MANAALSIMRRNMMLLPVRALQGDLMNALRIGGFVLAAFCVIPVFILFRVCGSVRQELRKAGIREPELSLQMLSGLGGARGFLFVAGWTLALIGSVLLAVFA
jgi:hypothetical protein